MQQQERLAEGSQQWLPEDLSELPFEDFYDRVALSRMLRWSAKGNPTAKRAS